MSIKDLLAAVDRDTPAYADLTRLISKCDSLGVARDDLAQQLAKMPHTPDGALVVLGETRLYCPATRGGVIGTCIPYKISVGYIQRGETPEPLVTGAWRFNDAHSVIQSVPLSWCYGSEASLLKAETKT